MPNSPASLPITRMLPGVHRIKRAKANRVFEYWYAWRGGPQILAAQASSLRSLAREVARKAPAAMEAYRAQIKTEKSATDEPTLYGLITRYLDLMNQDKSLALRTKTDRRKHLDLVRTELGDLTLAALTSPKARSFLLTWRDKRANTPKTADELLGALSLVLNWAVNRGELATNPVANFPRIYKVNRADIIWEPQHLETILAYADPPIAAAIRLAAVTGLRKNDLIALPWAAVKENAIIWQTGKSRGRKSVVLPITDAVREVLGSLERGSCPTVLSTSDGEPWTPPGRGLDSGVQRARNDAEEAAQTRSGSEATAGLDGLRFHDLRGTAATNYILAGLPLDDVATILGWELQRVKEIARRYVTGEAIGLGMIARLQEGQNRRPTVKPSVKPTSLRRGQKGSNAVRAVAGELGLEPRMTVPKTVVLPLHHSPAGPAFPKHSVRRRRSDTPSRFGMQHPLSGLFSLTVKMGRNGRLRPIEPMAISRVLTSGRRRQASPHGRSVAQPGRALRSGRRGRRFESSHSDHLLLQAKILLIVRHGAANKTPLDTFLAPAGLSSERPVS